MIPDPFVITTGIATATAIAGWAVAVRRGRRIRSMKLYQRWQDGRITDLTVRSQMFAEKVAAAQAQRIAASQKAAVVNRERAAERRSKRIATTVDALSHTPMRDRDEVVADIRQARPRRNSGSVLAEKTGG